MKRFILLSCVLLFFSECTIQKRLYRKGFYVATHQKLTINSKNRFEQLSSQQHSFSCEKTNHVHKQIYLNFVKQIEKQDGIKRKSIYKQKTGHYYTHSENSAKNLNLRKIILHRTVININQSINAIQNSIKKPIEISNPASITSFLFFQEVQENTSNTSIYLKEYIFYLILSFIAFLLMIRLYYFFFINGLFELKTFLGLARRFLYTTVLIGQIIIYLVFLKKIKARSETGITSIKLIRYILLSLLILSILLYFTPIIILILKHI